MNNWCMCWVFAHILLDILIFERLNARRLYKSLGVEGLSASLSLKFSQLPNREINCDLYHPLITLSVRQPTLPFH
jgi:hypothetical protein